MMTKVKSKKSNRIRRRRTSLEIEEEQSRTLYIRLPHTIKNEDEIKELFFGNFKVKIPRQSTRYCHVIFTDVKEKMKNLKAIKKKLVDGKPVFAAPPRPINLEKKKKPKQKKIVVPEPKDEPKLGKYLFITNIVPGVKCAELREAFPGAVSVALLKGLKNNLRQAKVKMPNDELCTHYLQNEAEWPTIRGKKVTIILAKKSKNSNKKTKKKSVSLKIHNDESKETASKESKEKSELVFNIEQDTEEDEDEEESEDEGLKLSEDEDSDSSEN